MEKLIKQLQKNEIFNGVTENEIKRIISNIRYCSKSYKKGEIIATEDEECTSLGLVIDGTIDIQRIYSSGKHIVLKRLGFGEVFGEALIFSSKNKYPSTIVSVVNSQIIYISKQDIIKLCTMNETILGNFMSALSNKILMLNSKIKNISFKSVKHKVINFILEEMKKQKYNDEIILRASKEEISNEIGIPRPSLSRELMNLRDLNYIEFDRNKIKILDVTSLEEELLD